VEPPFVGDSSLGDTEMAHRMREVGERRMRTLAALAGLPVAADVEEIGRAHV